MRLPGSNTRLFIATVKITAYFAAVRLRPDRAIIRDDWIERAIAAPVYEHLQADGRIRRWCRVPEMENRFLRVVLLSDGETVQAVHPRLCLDRRSNYYSVPSPSQLKRAASAAVFAPERC